jgi:hypothetical protein
MKKQTAIALICLISTACFIAGCSTVGEAKDLDPATGKISTQFGVKAQTLKKEKTELQKYKPLILTLGGDFIKKQTEKLGYFDVVVDRSEMEKLLIKENKSDLVTDVTNFLSWKKIADNYKPFLILQFDTRDEGRISFAQLKAFQADTADEVFTAEIKLDYMWKGVNDDTVFYPLFNEFIEWVGANK